MHQTQSVGTHRAVTPDLEPSVVDSTALRDYRSTPEVSGEPDFVEGHEDPAQSQELERQQDA